jgi:P4 family phage/plasmid primase-like protien
MPRQLKTRSTKLKSKAKPTRPAQHSQRKSKTPQAATTWHRAYRIPDELIEQAGVRHVTDHDARTILHLTAHNKKLDGIVFPYVDPATEEMVGCRIRLDVVPAGERKYHATSADLWQRCLYYPPEAAKKLKCKDTVSVLVEAEKSVLAGMAWAKRTRRADLLFIGIGGDWGWRDKNRRVLPDLDVCNGRRVVVLLDSNADTNPDVREARDALAAELGSRRCEVAIAELPQMKGVNGPDDLIAQPDGDDLLADVLDKAAGAAVAPYSEHALTERFAAEHKDSALYVPNVGWHVWDGQRWKLDEQGEVELLVQGLCRAAAVERDKLHEQNRLRSRRTREAVLREAQAHLSVSISELDKDGMLLNTPAGTVDLRGGKLRAARRQDYCTKLAGAAPGTEKPVRWLRFLDEIAQGNRELVAYLQRLAGYCLTGTTIEHALFFLYGIGANGKSVFVNMLLSALGDYARTAPMETFMVTHHPQHATSIAALRGARLVAATETEDGARWAESKLKELTGGTPITARRMRQDEFTFTPQLKLTISGNHKPRLRNVDAAMRRRLHLVPFGAYFPEGKRDPKLTEKLQAELSGILQWAIDGCLVWQREGLRAPDAVLNATADYFETQDVLGAWLEEETEQSKAHKDFSSTLYGAYKRWTETKGEFVHGQREFIQKLMERGFVLKKSHGVRQVVGLRLRPLEARGADGAGKTVTPLRVITTRKFALR